MNIKTAMRHGPVWDIISPNLGNISIFHTGTFISLNHLPETCRGCQFTSVDVYLENGVENGNKDRYCSISGSSISHNDTTPTCTVEDWQKQVLMETL